MGRAALVLVVLGALYLLCAGQASGTEAIAGAGSVLAAGGFGWALHHCGTRPIRLRAPWPRVIGRALAALANDTVRVGWMVLRGGTGVHSRQPFQAGDASAAEAGRRAIVTLAVSFAPNGYVTAIGPDEIMLHRLAAEPPRPDRSWPL